MDGDLKSVNCSSCHGQNWELLARHAGPVVEVACKRCGARFPLSDETLLTGTVIADPKEG